MLYPGLQPVQRKPRDQWLAVSLPFGLSEGRNSRRDNSIENKKIKTIFPHCHRDHRWKRDLDRSKNTRSEVAFSRQVFSLTAEHIAFFQSPKSGPSSACGLPLRRGLNWTRRKGAREARREGGWAGGMVKEGWGEERQRGRDGRRSTSMAHGRSNPSRLGRVLWSSRLCPRPDSVLVLARSHRGSLDGPGHGFKALMVQEADGRRIGAGMMPSNGVVCTQ